jgi:TPR repeat protein
MTRTAADHGYGDAQVALARMYLLGQGLPRDEAQALSLYGKAAAQGSVPAELDLGLLYAQIAQRPSPAAGSRAAFDAALDQMFGKRRWRETGGFRTAEREAQLRAAGLDRSRRTDLRPLAGHAPVAGRVRYRRRRPDTGAAARLRRSGFVWKKLLPEGLSGNQGPHLHVEPLLTAYPRQPAINTARSAHADLALATSAPPSPDGAAAPTARSLALIWLRKAASDGSAPAQHQLERLVAR